jgi:RNA polymerase-interacting CarD/CdnL/TRCF family regulator
MATFYPENTQYGMGADTQKALSSLQSDLFKKLQERMSSPTPTTQPQKVSVDPTSIYRPSSFTGVQLNKEPLKPVEGIPNQNRIFSASQLAGESPDYWSTPTQPGQYWVAPTDPSQVQVRQWPQELGGGQYFVDPSQPDKIVRSTRTYDSKSNILMRNGLPSYEVTLPNGEKRSLFEIDHIIPKFLGGTDDPANKELLSASDHDKKTRIQSVALTLLSAGKINESQARTMAFNWRDKDATNIPLPFKSVEEGGVGQIDLKTAQNIVKDWEQGPKVGWRNILNEIPETITNFGKNIPVLGPALAEGFRGFTKEATLGFAPLGQTGKYETTADEIAATLGNILGSTGGFLVGFGKFKAGLKAVKTLATGVRALETAEKAASGVGLLSKGVSMLDKLKVGKGATQTATSVIKGLPYMGQKAGLMIDAADVNKLRRAFTTQKVLTDMGLLAAYGQLHKQDAPGIENRINRFVTDVAFGGLLGSAGQNIKGYAKVGAGTMAISMMSSALAGADPEDIVKDSILNAAITTALHGTGYKSSKQAKAAQEAQINKAATDAANKMAVEFIAPYSGGKIKVGQTAPKMTESQALSLRQEAFDNLDKLIASTDGWDLDDIMRARTGIIVSTRQLYKNSLPKMLREKADIDDIISMGQKIKDRENFLASNPSMPKDVNRVSEIIKFGDLSKIGGQTASPDAPTGRISLSGISSKISNKNKENIARFNDAINNKTSGSSERAEPYVILADRPDIKPILERQNGLMTEYQIQGKERSPHKNPQNAVQAFGVVYDQNGRATTLSLGWVPRKFMVDESVFSQNSRIKALNEKYPDYKNLELYDPNLNKDAISTKMKTDGNKFVVAKVEKIIKTAKESGEPFVELSLDGSSWAKGKELTSKLNQPVEGMSIRTLPLKIQEIKKISKNINEARVRTALVGKTEARKMLDDIQDKIIKGVVPAKTQTVVEPGVKPAEKTFTPVEVGKNEKGYWVVDGGKAKYIPGEGEAPVPEIKLINIKKSFNKVNKGEVTTKKNIANTIGQQMLLEGESQMMEFKLPNREMSRDAYINYLKRIIDNVDVERPNGLSLSEYQAIKTNVKNRLKIKAADMVETAFDPKNEASFTGLAVQKNKEKLNNIEKKALELANSGMDEEMAVVEAIKNDTMEKLGVEAKKVLTPKKPFDPTAREGLQTIGIKSFAENIKGNISKQPKDGYSYGFSRTMDDGLRKAFGDKYDTSWSLNSIFDPTTKLGKMIWGPENLYNQLNQNKMPRSQFKPYLKAAQAGNKQAIKQAEVERGRILSQAEGTRNSGEMPLPSDIAEAKLNIKDDSQADWLSIKDLTLGEEKIFQGRIAAELDGKYTAERGAKDAKNLLFEIIKRFNESGPKVKAKGINLDDTINSIKEEATNYAKEMEGPIKTDRGLKTLTRKLANLANNQESLKKLKEEGRLTPKLEKQLSRNERVLETLGKVQEMLNKRLNS